MGDISTTAELRGAVNAADADGGFVAVKFWREGCGACEATVELFKEAARTHQKGRFYLVNYGKAKALCFATAIKVVPAAHLYAGNEMLDALPLGPSSWAGFAQRLKQVASGDVAARSS